MSNELKLDAVQEEEFLRQWEILTFGISEVTPEDNSMP